MEYSELINAVQAAMCNPGALSALERLYVEVQKQIDSRRPVCLVSGRCCQFEEYGHRLYVTTLELAAFTAGLSPETQQARNPGGCRFQVDRLCRAHAIRPFGCRIFFCDATAERWQQEQYERFHGELKQLHELHGVAYFYVEWRKGLEAVLGEAGRL